MYDPTDGRWLIDDPIGFDAGDTDLYRYVGNNPTNAIDPSGLAEDVFSGDDVIAHVGFSVGGGIGHRTAPASAGLYGDNVVFDKKDGAYGYFSHVSVNGDPDVANSCNTPLQLFPNDFDTHGGAIALRLRGLTSGSYNVKIRAHAHYSGTMNKLPSINLYKANEDMKNWQMLWSPNRKLIKSPEGGKIPGYYANDEIEITVPLNYKTGFLFDSSDTILFVPSFSFSGSKNDYMGVGLSLFVLEIKRR